MTEGRLDHTAPADVDGDEPAHVSDPGGIADGRWKKVDPRSVLVARWAAWIATGVLALVLGPLTWFGGLSDHPPPLVRWAVHLSTLSALAFAGWCSHVWPVLRYHHTRYRLDAVGVEIKRGVVWRSLASVPRTRVQHTDVSQGPIQRRFGLATLTIHTAGLLNASVTLAGLARETALTIRAFLVYESGGDGV